MSCNQFKQYLDAIIRVVEKLKECIYDSISSFDHGSKFQMNYKLGKIKFCGELLNEILPIGFNKSNLEAIDRHITFLNHYYNKEKSFPDFMRNADDLLKRDIPELKENLESFYQLSEPIQKKLEARTDEQVLTNLEVAQKKVETIFKRFHIASKPVAKRHDKRMPLKMNDEYDVQDLLETLLKVQFDDVRREDHTRIFAGSSNRIDFVLAQEQIGIEVKRTREGLTDSELGKQLINDIEHYKEHPRCKVLYFFVYDPEEYVKNPRPIENDLSKKRENMDVKVFIMPKRS